MVLPLVHFCQLASWLRDVRLEAQGGALAVASRVTAPEVTFGRFLRQQRLLTGLTLADMAARVGVTHQMVAKYERGQSRLSIGRLLAVAEALGRPLSSLLADYERHVGAPSQPGPSGFNLGRPPAPLRKRLSWAPGCAVLCTAANVDLLNAGWKKSWVCHSRHSLRLEQHPIPSACERHGSPDTSVRRAFSHERCRYCTIDLQSIAARHREYIQRIF